jgi:hypothetical protein
VSVKCAVRDHLFATRRGDTWQQMPRVVHLTGVRSCVCLCACVCARARQEVLINDYLDAYNWLKNNTPYDSRVMAW